MLRQRILSALVLAPVALAAVWAGGIPFALLSAVAAGIMVWEWDRMCRGRFGQTGRLVAVAVACAVAAGGVMPVSALAVVWVATLAAAALSRSGWLAMGALYVGLPMISLVWLREVGGAGTLFWLLAVVWATDTGAYAAGRTIGGPRLAPRVSPNKTWSGLAGGMTCAALAGGAVAAGLDHAQWPWLALAAAGLAVVAQIGDLFESSVKRRFKVKDTSNIIPGHGGVLDRVDGLIAAAPPVALLILAMGGGVGGGS